MSTAVEYVAAVAAVDAGTDALAKAMDDEATLLGSLEQLLQRQRMGVANDDVVTVDESVFGSWRVMHTLQEAQAKRVRLTRVVFGVDVALRDWSEAFGATLPDALAGPRDRLLAQAAAIGREIDINRQILQRAILQGESTLRTLLSGSLDQKTCYCETGASGRMASVVSVINRQV